MDPESTLRVSGFSAGWDHDVKVWNVDSGEEISTLVGHTGFVISVAFSPDGKYIATAGEYDTVRLLDAQSFPQFHSLVHHRDHVLNVVISPNGKRLVHQMNHQAQRRSDRQAFFVLSDARPATIGKPGNVVTNLSSIRHVG